MKMLSFILLVLFTSDFVYAQQGQPDCSKRITIAEDEVTGEKTAEIKDFIKVSLGSKSLTFYILRSKNSDNVYLNISVVGASRCIEDGEKANILFTDGTKLELLNLGYNCKADFSTFVYPYEEKDTPSYLCTKPIKTIRVWTFDGYVQMDMPIAKANLLMESFYCLMNLPKDKW